MNRPVHPCDFSHILGYARPAPVPAPGEPKPAHPDAELIRLGRALVEAWVEEVRLDVRLTAAVDVSEHADALVDAAYVRVSNIIKEIEPLTATTLEGVAVKCMVVCWCEGISDLSSDLESTDYGSTGLRFCAAVRRELLSVSASEATEAGR